MKRWQEWGKSIQVAATYIGTVVGAGFASGQEIVAFFTAYGVWGTVGILLATWLFVYLGYKMMLISHRLGTPSYESFNQKLFGPLVGRMINGVVFITLLGVTTVMLAGAGAIFHEQLNVPYLLGIGITVVLALLVLQKGLDRLLLVNTIVVPMMLFFSILILSTTTQGDPFPRYTPTNYEFLWQAILYVSFNLGMSQAVLIPLGSHLQDVRMIRRSAILGGLGLGFMLLVAHSSMLVNWNEVRMIDIPMVYIVEQWSDWLQYFFIAVLYAEIFTTLASNVYGVGQQLRELFDWQEQPTYCGLFAVATVSCLFGYSQLLMILYPLFGYLGLATILRVTSQRMSLLPPRLPR